MPSVCLLSSHRRRRRHRYRRTPSGFAVTAAVSPPTTTTTRRRRRHSPTPPAPFIVSLYFHRHGRHYPSSPPSPRLSIVAATVVVVAILSHVYCGQIRSLLASDSAFGACRTPFQKLCIFVWACRLRARVFTSTSHFSYRYLSAARWSTRSLSARRSGATNTHKA